MAVDPDLALVVGIVLLLMSLLSLAAAWADARRPVLGGIVCTLGVTLIGAAFMLKPGGYGPSQMAMAIFDILGRYVF